MAYVKKTWVDRDAENISGRALTDTTTGEVSHVTVALDEGEIYAEGTPFTAETFNDLEDRIEEGINSATGTSVEIFPQLHSGTLIATIEVDDEPSYLYAPDKSQTFVTPVYDEGLKIATITMREGQATTIQDLNIPSEALILDVTNVGV